KARIRPGRIATLQNVACTGIHSCAFGILLTAGSYRCVGPSWACLDCKFRKRAGIQAGRRAYLYSPAGNEQTSPLRLAEVVGALSLATDPGTGGPVESMLRVALFAVPLAGAHGASDSDLVTSYYLPLLALTGCTADASFSADMLGDETSTAMVDDWMHSDLGNP